jgi:hypothetical protein
VCGIVTRYSITTWLLQKGPALLKKHVRSSKYDDLCEEVELVHVNPCYAQVRTVSGQEKTVSLRDLAPLPPIQTVQAEPTNSTPESDNERGTAPANPTLVLPVPPANPVLVDTNDHAPFTCQSPAPVPQLPHFSGSGRNIVKTDHYQSVDFRK